ncbi:hypothetical protein ACS5PJ_14470 [Pseudarthrobacter sp. YS3]|uniref:hypothetical protein n=1 Tax=Pseudarthrobacter sp. YS3 TaxID=3453718 RepID=UPI003EED4CFC
MPQWISDVISVSPIMGALALACFVVWKVGPVFRKWSRFIDRVVGVPADPKTGQKEVPGIFERLDHQDEVLETIRHEVEFNNGSSVKDAVTRVESKLNEHLAATPAPVTTINVNPGGTP